MFDAQDARFRSIRLRPKQAGCAVCGENPSVTRLVDYEAFCGSAATDKVGHKRNSRSSSFSAVTPIYGGMLVFEGFKRVS